MEENNTRGIEVWKDRGIAKNVNRGLEEWKNRSIVINVNNEIAEQVRDDMMSATNNDKSLTSFNRLDCFATVSWISSTLEQLSLRASGSAGFVSSLSGLVSLRPSGNPPRNDVQPKPLNDTNYSLFTIHHSLKNVRNLTPSKKAAFTLAETLITLGIIGVVAAMTMPALIQSHRKHEVETKLARFYSVVNQAINTSVAFNGEVTTWFKNCGSSASPTCSVDEVAEWFHTYIGQYMKITEIKKKDDLWVYLTDGSIWIISPQIRDMEYYTSEKALKNGKAGINHFAFYFRPMDLGYEDSYNLEKLKYSKASTVEPYTYSWDGTLEGLNDPNNNFSCVGKYHAFCTKLIQMNGWKIPKDYPLKF